MKKSKKSFCWMWLAFLYFALLFGYAGIFTLIANSTDGEMFIFREDLLIPIQIEEIQQRMNIDKTDSRISHEIKELLLNDSRVHREGLHDLTDDWYEGYEPLGYVWADFYRAFYRSRGATHCIIEYHDKPLNPGGPYPRYYKEVFIRVCRKVIGGTVLDFDHDFPVVLLSLVEDALEVIETAELSVDWALYSQRKPESEIEKLSSGNAYVVSIDYGYFHDIISSAYWTPDNGLNIFSEVYNNRNYNYRYWDFFYFSAVALTTLGYGDILPNSTIVRVLVASEAILGIVVITFFIGLLIPLLNKHKTA